MKCRRVRIDLEKHGDVLSEPRMIDHRAYFPNDREAASFAAKVEGMGFDVAPPKPMDDGQYAIDFERIDLPDDMDDLAPRLANLAAELTGSYDGWGCEIVPANQG